jgi:2-C-methyl-D-erythritol 4-phosphate cytidylyltransferase/2-C-methyl-D-erythritol 2,4-cyclodiphosphate synthase
MTVIAIVVAAGSGSRAGGAQPKQYQTIAGKPVIHWTLKTFCEHPKIDRVCAVIAPEHAQLFVDATKGLKLEPPVPGGPSRQESCRLGVESLHSLNPQHVLIHDAARPFVSTDLIDRVIGGLAHHPCVIPGIPVGDTVKRAPGGIVASTVDRTDLWAVQKPQGFAYELIRDAHAQAAHAGEHALTDDAAVAERAGHKVAIVFGTAENRKLTTPHDIEEADRLLTERNLALLPDVRVGQGFDVHKFGAGNSVTLLGVAIEHDFGLVGHSDADAPMHALTDAIFGALGEADIGTHFPPSEPRWRGAESRIFLEHAVGLVSARRGLIAHVDISILAEAPRIAPHIAAMKVCLGQILHLHPSQIGIKATTMETLGFVGRREGIAALATATLRLPARGPAR